MMRNLVKGSGYFSYKRDHVQKILPGHGSIEYNEVIKCINLTLPYILAYHLCGFYDLFVRDVSVVHININPVNGLDSHVKFNQAGFYQALQLFFC